MQDTLNGPHFTSETKVIVGTRCYMICTTTHTSCGRYSELISSTRSWLTPSKVHFLDSHQSLSLPWCLHTCCSPAQAGLPHGHGSSLVSGQYEAFITVRVLLSPCTDTLSVSLSVIPHRAHPPLTCIFFTPCSVRDWLAHFCLHYGF